MRVNVLVAYGKGSRNMPDIIEPLTIDEETVLSIAAQGKSMMAIGRWEVPTLTLWKHGLLFKHDDFNYTITEAGKVVLAAHQQATDAELKSAVDKYAENRAKQVSARQAEIDHIWAKMQADDGSDKS